MAQADLRQRLRDALAAQADVAAAWLFGSRARGAPGPLSDIDVAVLLAEGAPTATRQLELAVALTAALGTDAIDVVVVNDAPIDLAFRVVRDGELLLCRDDAARLRHRARTIAEYLDTAPLRASIAEGQRRRLAEGSFGRP